MAIRQVEGQETFLVEKRRVSNRRRTFGMEVFRGLALNEDGVRLDLQNRVHREGVRAAQVDERAHETTVVRDPLVPPSVLRREERSDEKLVDRRVVSNPGEAGRKCLAVLRNQRRPVGVLKAAADPVWNA